MNRELLTQLKLATMDSDSGPYGLIESGAVAIEAGEIKWCGPMAELPAWCSDWQRRELQGRLVTPALVDCHTHLVFGGNRAREFEMRLEGASYEELARAGGGILSTVKSTRQADSTALLVDALTRVDALMAEGVTTIEIKSGYGLDVDGELKMLRVARQIAKERPVRVVTSFLAAHAVPPEFTGRPDAYIDELCIPLLIEAHGEGLVDSVDGFCEGIAFNCKQIGRLFDQAHKLDLPVRLHAEQLSNLGGATLAASYHAQSVDHLEYLDEPGVKAMQSAGSTAVLLPGAFYTLRETQHPPVDLLRGYKVPIAIATDCNPGSSPLASLLLSMNMACTLFRLTPEESLAGVTRCAAGALGLSDIGQIAPGFRAELSVWNVDHPAELSYRIGFNPLHEVVSQHAKRDQETKGGSGK